MLTVHLPDKSNPPKTRVFSLCLVTFAQNETYRTLTDLLDLQPKTATGGENRDLVIEKLAKDVLSRVPQPLPLATVMEKYPVLYEQVKNLQMKERKDMYISVNMDNLTLVDEYRLDTRDYSVSEDQTI